jgi:glycogen debranching enzyme
MKYLFVFVTIIWITGCKTDLYETLPAIFLTENENKQFTFTNKVAGFYLGNSHLENNSVDLGWIVNEIHYLKDYRVYTGREQISRDSLHQFIYYPLSFIRDYTYPLKETFTFLDTVDAIIWEFESTLELKNFSFLPQFPYDVSIENLLLTNASSPLIISPEDQNDLVTDSNRKWIGFFYLPIGTKKVIIVGAIESSKNRLIYLLDFLSKNFEEKRDEKIERLNSLLKMNDTYTNLPEITEAIAWAQLSLDALITEQRVKGIWAGLPWFNDYWGRETFISFSGALLVSGKFGDARKILDSFSHYQLQNEGDDWEGRIPNRITNDEVIYNTADATWWYIREAYEYLLYSGDSTFIQQIYPIIRRAIQGAVRHRIDENFFLLHGDAETWMDTKKQDGAWSPRGNRAIEIQALWYTALQIGAKFAHINDEDQLGEHWLAISHTLKRNFKNKFWSPVNERTYDHLNIDGTPDNKIRPNQILAVYIPLLPGIDPLFSNDQSARITNTVVKKLTYRYGVASLWQEDKDFHPWYIYPSHYAKDEAYYNGTVWTWLSGPVISSMLLFNRYELAFNLFDNTTKQIIFDDAIGNLAELRDALPRVGSGEPCVFGNISQAWSLAEFLRNFYQDFIGYRPNSIENRINLSPKIPTDLSYIFTNLPYKNSFISFTYRVEEELYIFNIEIGDDSVRVDVSFQFPGFDAIEFRLDEDNPSFNLSLDPLNQKSFHQYQNLDWYFAQPELLENLKALQ